MIYPRIQRRSLGLVLMLLICTLGAVGVTFLLYFFNENNSLLQPILTVHTGEDYHGSNKFLLQQGRQHLQQSQHQHIVDNENFDFHDENVGTPWKNKKDNSVKPTVKNILPENFHRYLIDGSEQDLSLSNSLSHETESTENFNIDNEQETINNSNKNKNNFYTNSDTIYIDDYDRFNFDKTIHNSDGNNNSDDDLLDINGIDYFDTIIKDHKQEKERNNKIKVNKVRQRKANPKIKLNLDEEIIILPKSFKKQRKNRPGKLNSKSVNRKIKIIPNDNDKNSINRKKNATARYKIMKFQRNNDNQYDDYDIDIDFETIGSGSGHYMSDTEIDGNDRPNKLNKNNFNFNTNRKHIKNKNVRKMLRNYRIGSRNENWYSVSNDQTTTLTTQTSIITPAPMVERLSTSLLPSLSSSTSTLVFVSNSTSLSSLPVLPPSSNRSLLNRTRQVNRSQLNLANRYKANVNTNKKWMPPSIVSNQGAITNNSSLSISRINTKDPRLSPALGASLISQIDHDIEQARERIQSGNGGGSSSANSAAWLETRTRRILGNVKKSEERSRQLLLCEEAGGGELCRMLFKGHLNE